ncbi:MAG TPA: hypothetical protein VJW20_00335 [Candidatus Angelobacter sp.]|nr:hypothetical protein [Candidatus Angelobacter sp.]
MNFEIGRGSVASHDGNFYGTFTTRMRQRNFTIHRWLWCLMLLTGTLLRGQTADLRSACENTLPAQAQKTVAAKLKHWKVLTVADLSVDDRKIWEDDDDGKCPGITAGQFGPNQSQAYAVTLVRSMKGALYQTLVLVAEKNQRYQITTLSRSQKAARPSIVRRLPGGTYSSAEGEIQIDAAFDVIAYETIEAGTIIYYWNKSKYKNLIISE